MKYFKKERLVTCLIDKSDKIKKLDRKYDIIYCEEENNACIRNNNDEINVVSEYEIVKPEAVLQGGC